MIEQLMPIHPKLVHFPIALIITAFILDILSWVFRKEYLHKASLVIYVFAALITPLVVLSGLFEQQRLHLNHAVLLEHKQYALITMWVSLSSLPVIWLLKRRYPGFFRIFFTCLLLCLVLVVTFTAHLGGSMVYKYGAGVAQ